MRRCSYPGERNRIRWTMADRRLPYHEVRSDTQYSKMPTVTWQAALFALVWTMSMRFMSGVTERRRRWGSCLSHMHGHFLSSKAIKRSSGARMDGVTSSWVRMHGCRVHFITIKIQQLRTRNSTFSFPRECIYTWAVDQNKNAQVINPETKAPRLRQ